MKSLFLSFFFMILVASSPLGDRSVFSRHNGVPLLNARKFILRSNLQAPPSCASGVQLPPSASSDIPPIATSIATDTGISDVIPTATDENLDPTATPTPNTTDGTLDPTATLAPNTTGSPVVSDTNSTVTDSTDTTPTSADIASNATDTSLSKRYAQLDIPGLALTWQDLCLSSGGDIFTNDPCFELGGLSGINALLADADPCDQQNIADAMIDFAKSKGILNSDELVALAVQYRRYPRNALNILGIVPSSPYCLIAPKNIELVGVWNDQLEGVVPGLFGGPDYPIVAFGTDGTCPYGLTPDVSTCSCISSDSATSGIDTGISSLNSTDTSDSVDSGDSTDLGTDTTTSTDSSANATSTATDSEEGGADVSDATDATDAGDDGTDTSDTTDATDTEGDASDSSNAGTSEDGTDATNSSSSTTDSASDSITATATDTSTEDVSASTTDPAAGNTGTPNVNDPQGRR